MRQWLKFIVRSDKQYYEPLFTVGIGNIVEAKEQTIMLFGGNILNYFEMDMMGICEEDH